MFDGHMTHVSLPVIERALQDKIITLKFPTHAADFLQSLDVSCFGPLKRRWEQLLQQRVNTFGAKTALSKGDFVNKLCNKIWNDVGKYCQWLCFTRYYRFFDDAILSIHKRNIELM